jgi:hypothetical protein
LGNFAAFLDASVLYPAPLRDLLLELAVSDLYRAKWSDAVHEEWITAVLENRPDLTRAQLERTRDLMNAHARDALVTDFEQLIDILELPDPDDRHVLAAAIRAVQILLSRPISGTSLSRTSIAGGLKRTTQMSS